MENKKISTFYYVETFLLLGFFIISALILSRSFASSKLMSYQAKDLTNAVCIAENVAEIIKAADTKEEALLLLQQNLNGDEKGNLSFDRNMNSAENGYFDVSVSLDELGYEAEIRVEAGGKEIYVLHAGNYPQEAGHE